jgi:hypothetical protein
VVLVNGGGSESERIYRQIYQEREDALVEKVQANPGEALRILQKARRALRRYEFERPSLGAMAKEISAFVPYAGGMTLDELRERASR